MLREFLLRWVAQVQLQVVKNVFCEVLLPELTKFQDGANKKICVRGIRTNFFAATTHAN